MVDDTQTGGSGDESLRPNRRRVLKGLGAATLGVAGATGTASAQQYQFDSCRRVCGDTDGDLAIVATDDGFECRPMTTESDDADVPWDWGAHCYTATEDEVIVGALEESAWQGRRLFDTWACELKLNPNACAKEHYEDAVDIRIALDGSESCGACAGTIVRGDGKQVTATDRTPAPREPEQNATTDAPATGEGDGAANESDGGAGSGEQSENGGGGDGGAGAAASSTWQAPSWLLELFGFGG